VNDWYQLGLSVFHAADYGLIFYVAAINLTYLVMVTLGYFVLRNRPPALSPSQREALIGSPMLPGITVIAPAHNEAASIRDSVKALLGLRYPKLEVVVVNDGSRDETLQILIDSFRLYRSSRRVSNRLETERVRAVYESLHPIRLVVVDKENGGKADAINAGLNVARSALVAVVDADSLLDDDALLLVAKPFLDEPGSTLACGGIIRIANGCTVSDGRILEVRAPRGFLAAYQVAEYLRAFLGGRVALSFLNSLLIVSGAFGLFDRAATIAAGGFSRGTVGEDMEMTLRLHRFGREHLGKYRVAFVPEPVCWTEVPESLGLLRSQRNRWQRGTVESLRAHRRLLFNPRFRGLGLLGMPYVLIFEALGPIAEIGGYLFTIAGLAAGLITPSVALLFFLVSVGFGAMLSTFSVVLAEMTGRRYPGLGDMSKLLWVSIAENFGLRQMVTWWRACGLVDALRGKTGWGVMKHTGFRSRTLARAAK
jgi:cellulose synthase/poly-beta-1,6-N-acetylglucosamine synthase-like glycosyltransferase